MIRYVAFEHSGSPRFARVTEQGLELLAAPPWHGEARGVEVLSPSELEHAARRAPVLPSKIICVAKNYREHAKEMQGEVPEEPALFFKPPSSLLGPGGQVVLPRGVERTDFEAELGVVIGKQARNVSRADAMNYVFGYTVVCDVSARDYQKTDRHWTRAKGSDTFCPTGAELVAPDGDLAFDPQNLRLRLWQNGELRQDGSTADMVFPIVEIIAYASSFMTLEPGDLIATGTPHGVGPLAPGDQIEIEVEGVGRLAFSVALERG